MSPSRLCSAKNRLFFQKTAGQLVSACGMHYDGRVGGRPAAIEGAGEMSGRGITMNIIDPEYIYI